MFHNRPRRLWSIIPFISICLFSIAGCMGSPSLTAKGAGVMWGYAPPENGQRLGSVYASNASTHSLLFHDRSRSIGIINLRNAAAERYPGANYVQERILRDANDPIVLDESFDTQSDWITHSWYHATIPTGVAWYIPSNGSLPDQATSDIWHEKHQYESAQLERVRAGQRADDAASWMEFAAVAAQAGAAAANWASYTDRDDLNSSGQAFHDAVTRVNGANAASTPTSPQTGELRTDARLTSDANARPNRFAGHLDQVAYPTGEGTLVGAWHSAGGTNQYWILEANGRGTIVVVQDVAGRTLAMVSPITWSYVEGSSTFTYQFQSGAYGIGTDVDVPISQGVKSESLTISDGGTSFNVNQRTWNRIGSDQWSAARKSIIDNAANNVEKNDF